MTGIVIHDGHYGTPLGHNCWADSEHTVGTLSYQLHHKFSFLTRLVCRPYKFHNLNNTWHYTNDKSNN